MAKTTYTFTEEINGEEKTLQADLQNIEQAKGFAEASRKYLLSVIKIKNDAGEVLASKVFDWA